MNEILRQPAMDAGKFNKHNDFYGWPLPENIGITPGRDTGLVVEKVAPGSAADKAGIRAGDNPGAANGRRLFSHVDLRGALHRLGRKNGSLDMVWLRNRVVLTASLQLTGQWYRTDLTWRKSVADAAVGAASGFPWPLACSERERKQHGVAKDKMCVKPFFPKGPTGKAGEAGLKADDWIIEVNGDDRDISGREFLVWFKLKFEPGDEVKLTVIGKDGKRREVKYPAPDAKH